MPQSGRMTYFVNHESCIMAQERGFWGTIEDLKAKAQKENKPCYIEAIDFATKRLSY